MLRKFLVSTVALVAVSGTAFAADLPSRSAPPVYVPPPPIFTWTGIYVGAELGYQFGTSNAFDQGPFFPGAIPSYHPSGVIGGGYAGYNWQISQFVIGIEGNVDGSSYNASVTDGLGFVSRTREPISGAVRGRVGYAWDRVLFYATGGVAFASIRNSTFDTLTGAFDQTDTGRVGWTAGGGVEYAIDNNWSVRADYRYTDYGHYTVFEPNTSGDLVRHREFDNKVMAGISYKFAPPPPPAPPVVAKY